MLFTILDLETFDEGKWKMLIAGPIDAIHCNEMHKIDLMRSANPVSFSNMRHMVAYVNNVGLCLYVVIFVHKFTNLNPIRVIVQHDKI